MEKVLKILVATKSCQRDLKAGCHTAIRETWGALLPPDAELRFFVGGEKAPENLAADEVFTPSDDTYWVLWPKVKAIARYSVEHGYDFTFCCDTDTYVVPSKWRASGFEAYDFCGRMAPLNQEMGKPYPAVHFDNGEVADPFYAYMSGGVGYFFSRKAAPYIADDTATHRKSEDVAMGQVCGPLIQKKILTGAHLPLLEDKGSFHLGCGWYGGGHKDNRLDPAAAMRKKHSEMTR